MQVLWAGCLIPTTVSGHQGCDSTAQMQESGGLRSAVVCPFWTSAGTQKVIALTWVICGCLRYPGISWDVLGALMSYISTLDWVLDLPRVTAPQHFPHQHPHTDTKGSVPKFMSQSSSWVVLLFCRSQVEFLCCSGSCLCHDFPALCLKVNNGLHLSPVEVPHWC